MSGGSNFQIFLEGFWKEFDADVSRQMQKAYSQGSLSCQYSHGGQRYECDFQSMQQKNLATGKVRSIRPPASAAPPARSDVNMTVKVPEGSLGKMIQVPHPNATGQTIDIQVPQAARVGQSLVVPVPEVKVDTISNNDVDVKDTLLAEETSRLTKDFTKRKYKWSTGKKVAVNTAAMLGVGGAAAGGIKIGMMIAEDGWDATGEELEDFAEDAGEHLLDAAEASLDWVADTGDKVGDFILDLFTQ